MSKFVSAATNVLGLVKVPIAAAEDAGTFARGADYSAAAAVRTGSPKLRESVPSEGKPVNWRFDHRAHALHKQSVQVPL